MAVLRGHSPTRLGAAAAGISAPFHLRVVAELVAASGALLADLSTDGADASMERRLADHEIRAGMADLGAVEQQSYVDELAGAEKQKENIGGLLKTPEVLRSRYLLRVWVRARPGTAKGATRGVLIF